LEFNRFIQEEVDFRPVRPIGEGIDFAISNRLGTRPDMPRISTPPAVSASSWSPLTAVTDNGTSCRFSSRRCAVTTISSKAALFCGVSSCAKAAGAMKRPVVATAIAALDAMIERMERINFSLW
jgi:hypothetical protein